MLHIVNSIGFVFRLDYVVHTPVKSTLDGAVAAYYLNVEGRRSERHFSTTDVDQAIKRFTAVGGTLGLLYYIHYYRGHYQIVFCMKRSQRGIVRRQIQVRVSVEVSSVTPCLPRETPEQAL